MQSIKNLSFTVLLVAAVSGNVCRAGAVVGSTEFTQIANNFELIGMYTQDARNLVASINQYETMLKNLENLADFDNIKSLILDDIEELANIVQVGQAVAFSSSNLEEKFREQNKGYLHYVNSFEEDKVANTPTDFSAVYQEWAENNLNSTLGALQAANIQSESMEDEVQLMEDIQQKLETSSGALQATQAAGAIASQQVAQMQKLRELTMAQIQAQTTYQAAQIERQAIKDAWFNQFTAPQTDPTKIPTFNNSYSSDREW